jgi:nicotinamidase-related amidase
VISTALPAADAGVHIRVVADACAGATDMSHEQALAVMGLYTPLIEIVTMNALAPG